MRLPLTSHQLAPRSMTWGALAAFGMTLFYGAVLTLGGGVGHLFDQAIADRYWLLLIIPGFGLQVMLLMSIRHEHVTGMAATGAGPASSVAGMVACCAHHLAEIFPIIGVAGAAGFLTDWKPWFLTVGVGITYAMTARSWRHLARMSSLEEEACVAVS